MYDVIVVGARCAGSPLAMLLARRGAKVLLVDRATFPSDIPHGHFVHRHGPRRLRDWGLLSRVASRTPAITNMLFDAGDFPLVARNLVEDGVAWGYGPRRTTLDAILVMRRSRAVSSSARASSVDEYVFEDDALRGIRGRGPNGSDGGGARDDYGRGGRPQLPTGSSGSRAGIQRGTGASLLLLLLLERRAGRGLRALRPH